MMNMDEKRIPEGQMPLYPDEVLKALEIELKKPITYATLYPYLTMAGVARVWQKGVKSVEMQVLKGRLDAYKDGRIWLIDTSSVVELWGEPPKKEQA